MKGKIVGKKQIGSASFKTSPSIPTDEQLAIINQFTRRTFKADELYVGQMRLAHNAIDRDNERFSEEMLKGFAASAIRKTMLLDHDNKLKNATGKFFAVELEELTVAEAKDKTGDDYILPPGKATVMFMSPWFYIPKAGIDEKTLVMIDAGVFDYASIGFAAENRVPVYGQDGKVLYREYRGKGEMREGSLVYLGAQNGAAVKAAGADIDNKDSQGEEGDEDMDMIKTIGGITGKSLDTAEDVVAEVKSLIKAAADKDAKIKELEPQAEDGKAYRKSLVADVLKFGVLIDEVKAAEDDQKKEEAFMMTLPIDRLKSLRDKYETRARESYPDKFTVKAKDEANRKETTASGENPVVANAKKRAEAAAQKR